MQISIKQICFGNFFLKVLALILGFLFWSILSESFQTAIWLEVPLSFYNNEQNLKIEAPELVSIQLAGKRSNLNNLDYQNLAIHINVQDLVVGTNNYNITNQNLFLSPAINLCDYNPQNLVIKIQQNI